MQNKDDSEREIENLQAELDILRARTGELEETLRESQSRFHRRVEELNALQETVLDITAAHDLPTLLETIVERAARLLDASGGGLYLCEPEQGQVRCVVSYNTERDYRGTVLHYGEGAAGTVALTGKPLIIKDYSAWEGRAPVFEEEQPFRAVLAVPMIWKGQVIGVIDLLRYAEGRAFNESARDLLTLFANHAAIAVGNTRLYEQAQAEIAERKQLEQQIEERRRYLEYVLACAPDAIVTLDPQQRILEWNPGAEALFGYRAEKAIGRDLDELIAAPDADMYAEAVGFTLATLAGKPVPPTETIRFRKDGMPVHVILTGSPILTQGELLGVVAVYTDITRHKEAAEELRRISEFNQRIVQNMAEGIAVQDAQGNFTFVNPAAATMLGYEPEDLLGQSWTLVVPTDQQPTVRAADERRRCGEADQYEVELERQDGTRLPVLASGSPLFDPKTKRFEGTLAVFTNITDRRLAEAEIRRRNRELALLNRVIAATAASRDIESILEIACRELALALDVPQAAAAIINEEGTAAVVIAEYLAEGRPSALDVALPVEGNPSIEHLFEYNAPFVVEDARTDPRMEAMRHISLQRGTISLLVLPLIVEGEVIGSLGVDAIEPRSFTQDEMNMAQRVADQVSGALARARLEEAQRRLNAAVEQAAESVIITDTEGNIVYVNPAFERLSGYSNAEAIGRSANILKSNKHSPEFYQELWQTITGGDVWQGRIINKKKDGSFYTEESTITPVRDQPGEIVNFVAVNHDVTREVELEEQLRQSQKMEALGQLAGGIAHDFNNLLTIIQLSTRLLQRQLRPEDPPWEYVQRIEETGQRASTLTRRLLSFSRREMIEPRILNLNQAVSELSRMLKRIIGEDIELLTDLEDDLWPVRADLTQFDQIIMNLVVNARDAMPQGGTLIIKTNNAVLDEVYAAHHVDVQAGEYVQLSITDTGVGIDEETRPHIFEPFFTTKERGQGTGLGLAAVFGIVKQNRGHIWFHSEKGMGTTFRIYLPRVIELGSQSESRPLPPAMAGLVQGTETILVVEDEADVLNLIVRVLQACGYQVLIAKDGPQALKISGDYKGPIHLLISDIVMPRMYGKELAEQLRAQRAEMRLLFISGYPDTVIVQPSALLPEVAFLPKPFTVEDLTAKVRAVLDVRA